LITGTEDYPADQRGTAGTAKTRASAQVAGMPFRFGPDPHEVWPATDPGPPMDLDGGTDVGNGGRVHVPVS
jgi:hypothetical protein